MTYDPQAKWIPSPFYTPGRLGYTPTYLILHGTAGGSSAEGIAAWFQNTQAQASSHYIIGRDGTLVQCVEEENWAWANGTISGNHDPWWQPGLNPNLITISIEHCKPSTDNSDDLTEVQKQASFALIERICTRWSIPRHQADSTGGITGHFSIDERNRKNCPGSYPWQELWTYLQAGESPPMLEITDPVVKDFFTDSGNGRWHCHPYNVDLIGANLTFYRTYGGPAVFGLPLTNEMYPKNNTSIVPCERAIICYDPGRVLDTPPIAGPCYLLHINTGMGQQLIAQNLVNSLQLQVRDLNTKLVQLQQSAPTSAHIKALESAIQSIYSIAAQSKGINP